MMRLFYSTDKSDSSFYITGDDHRHILKVLRYKKGDSINVIDGSGYTYSCIISLINKKNIEATIVDKTLSEPLSYKLGIGISPLKNMSRFEWFLEKSVEIGITDIFPVIAKRSEKLNMKTDRAKRIIQSAMKQSGNVYEPILHPLINLGDFANLQGWNKKYLAYINDEHENFLAQEDFKNDHILIGVGPEGGFTEDEARVCTNSNFIPVSLGKSRLRTETAGIVCCQIVKTIHELNN